MKRLPLIVMAVLSLAIVSARAQIPVEKQQEIQKMLRCTETEKMMSQFVGQMIANLKTQMPQASETFWERFNSKINIHDLMEQLVAVYDKYYTLEDLKAINAFYASPAGQKVLTSMPQVIQESMKIGQAWGEKIARQAALEARKTK